MSDLVERLRTFDTHSNDARAVCDEAAAEIERLQAVVDEVRDLPWVLKHAAGAYIDAGRPEHHQPTMDRAERLLNKLRALGGES